VPVFPDGASLDRAARDLAVDSDASHLVGMRGLELIEWTHTVGLVSWPRNPVNFK
jgi:hypothetical protein